MDREKLIEEMVEHIDNYIQQVDVNHWYSDELDEGLAKHLYQADYRKKSEIAREVISDVIDVLDDAYRKCNIQDIPIILMIVKDIIKLRKKYTEE